MNEFIFFTLVPALFFVVLIFGAVGILSVLLAGAFDGKVAGDVFDKIFFASFIGICSTGILLLLTMGVSGLIMLFNF
jgi:hypothetical protein